MTKARFVTLVCFAVGFLVYDTQSQVRKKVTVNDLMNLASIVDVEISTKGNSVAYVISRPSLAKNQHEPSLYVVPISGGEPRRLAENVRIFGGNLPAPRLRWSPDGRISFLAFRDDKPQVFAIAESGGEPEAITNAAEGVFQYEWAPDGKRLAFITRDAMSAEEQRRRKDNSFVIHVDAPERATRIAVLPLGGEPRIITPADQYVESISWSPDGREIAYAASSTTGFLSQYDTRIYAVTMETGAIRSIVDRPGMNSTPRYSPDGSQIAFVSTSEKISLMAPRGLAVAKAQGGSNSQIRNFPLNDAWVSDVSWAPDSKSIYLLTTDGIFGQKEHMFEQPLVRVWIGTGKAEVVAGDNSANYLLTLTADGRTLAYKRVDPRTMGDVFAHDLQSGKIVKLTEINPELQHFELGNIRTIHWNSFDGKDIWGLLITPPNYSSGRLPLLVYCHGGPNGGVTYGLFPQFMHTVPQVDYYPVEALVSAGFVVFFPMPRGGIGYGEAGQRAIVNDWGGADFKDIMTGVDNLIAKGIADPDRLGVMGASYGGFMTPWILTQTKRFKAASSAASIIDLTDMYFLADGGEVMAEYFKKPWEAPESYRSHSPLTYADRVTTPLLIQHGERDLRVPISNAWKFYRALKQRGKTVELDIHPRSSHVFFEPVQEREAMQRNLDWFLKWIPVSYRTP